MMKIENERIWAEAYRPQSVADIVLPKQNKKLFEQYVKDRCISNHLLLSGSAGMGKTTAAIALCKDIGADYIIIPASIETGVDMVREKMIPFAATVSFTDTHKVIILDEADYLSKNAQPALRNFMDEYGHNCILIMTCNEKSRMIDAIVSRVTNVDYNIPSGEKPHMAAAFSKRVLAILDNEGVKYDQPAVIEVVKKKFPDWRSTLVMLQRIATENDNFVSLERVRTFNTAIISELVGYITKKEFTKARKWIGENSDIDSESFYRALYEILPEICVDASNEVTCVISVAQYQYRESSGADVEINRAACAASLMLEGHYK